MRLLRVVVLQRRLIRALCALPEQSSVDQTWLCALWKCVDADWIRRFWENDSGKRAVWIQEIAAAPIDEKKEILTIADEQFRFRELWTDSPSIQMHRVKWNRPTFVALKNLLKCFYDPLFYRSGRYEGFVIGKTALHKDIFLGGIPSRHRKVCPYCDNYLQKTELDHFLPKDGFPFLSCHPDNLIPSCHDSNSGSHKGTTVPLDWGEQDQAGGWFHPRWRSANGRITANIVERPERTLAVELKPINDSDAVRVSNLDHTFKISEFWSNQIEGEMQLIGSQVTDELRADNVEATQDTVRSKLLRLARLRELEIGKRGLAICHHALYLFAANNPAVVSDIVRECKT